MLLVIFGVILVGLALGIIGSGGAIITVPILVYALALPEKLAIASALIIVASISLVAAISGICNKAVNWPLFAIPGMFTTILGAWYKRPYANDRILLSHASGCLQNVFCKKC